MILKNNANSKFNNFLKGKGFYVALGLSALMIGTASFFAYNRTADKLGNQLNSIDNSSQSQNSSSEYEDVAGYQSDVPKTTKPNLTKTETETESEHEVNAEADVDLSSEETTEEEVDEAYADAEQPAEQANTISPCAMPIEGEIIAAFSGTELVKSNTTGAWQTHNGVDIAGNLGDEIKVITDGTVTEIKEDPLWGITIEVDHGGGLVSRYCGLNSGVTVQSGSEVMAGDVIGAIGDTCEIESADPPHLHLEVLKNNQYIDPMEFISNSN